jgi:hypothetical protein
MPPALAATGTPEADLAPGEFLLSAAHRAQAVHTRCTRSVPVAKACASVEHPSYTPVHSVRTALCKIEMPSARCSRAIAAIASAVVRWQTTMRIPLSYSGFTSRTIVLTVRSSDTVSFTTGRMTAADSNRSGTRIVVHFGTGSTLAASWSQGALRRRKTQQKSTLSGRPRRNPVPPPFTPPRCSIAPNHSFRTTAPPFVSLLLCGSPAANRRLVPCQPVTP